MCVCDEQGSFGSPQNQTLARLELCAALSGARISRLIVHEIDLPIEKVVYWSDSMIVVQYLQNGKRRFKVFVANRVHEIVELTDVEQWRHIKGTMNPADVLSRGVIDPRKLLEGDWFSGPQFLGWTPSTKRSNNSGTRSTTGEVP